MSSTMEQEQQETLDQLVESVLQRDILFVLYHLQRLDPASLNQLDPLQDQAHLLAAMLLSDFCPRRALILGILLAVGVPLGSTVPLPPCMFVESCAQSDAEASENDIVRTARSLVYDMPIEAVEIWLQDNGLDGVGDTPAPNSGANTPELVSSLGTTPSPIALTTPADVEEFRSPFIFPSRSPPPSSAEDRLIITRPPLPKAPRTLLFPDPTFDDDELPLWSSTQPTTRGFTIECPVDSDVLSLRFALEQQLGAWLVTFISFPVINNRLKHYHVVLTAPVKVQQILRLAQCDLGFGGGRRARVKVDEHVLHDEEVGMGSSCSTTRGFSIACPLVTHLSALELFLERELGASLISFIAEPILVGGAKHYPVVLKKFIAVDQILKLEECELEQGFQPRVKVDRGVVKQDSTPPSIFFNGAHQHANFTAASSHAFSLPQPPTRPNGRPLTIYSYTNTLHPGPQRAPPPGATQKQLDRWAEESFVGRWAADLPGLKPGWNPNQKAAPWRGHMCPAFPPTAGMLRRICWGRNCDFAHHPAELRHADGSLVDLEAAADFAS